MQKVWALMLDDEFLEAYRHGIVLQCADGVVHRVYPRIFTYSADYPEKYVETKDLTLSFLISHKSALSNYPVLWRMSLPTMSHSKGKVGQGRANSGLRGPQYSSQNIFYGFGDKGTGLHLPIR